MNKIEFTLEGFEFSALPDAAEGQPVVHRVQLLRKGTKESGVLKLNTRRKFRVTDEDILAVMSDLQSRSDALPMIRQHGKGPWGEEAVGWFRSFEANSQGIFGDVEWLPDFVPQVRGKKWRYSSPGLLGERDDDGYLRPRVIVECSATNTADIDNMLPLAASSKSDVNSQTASQSASKERDMKITPAMLKALGFKETDTPTDEEIEKAFAALVAKDETPKPKADETPKPKLVSTPPPSDEPKTVAVAASSLTPEAMSALTETIRETVKAEFEAKERTRSVAELVAEGERTGKLTVKSKEHFEKLANLDLSAATTLLAGMAVVAPVKGGPRISTDPVKLSLSATADRDGKADRATKIFQLAREKGISTEQAEKFLASREAN